MEHYIYSPQQQPNASIIWLHGLGADANDFAGLVEKIKLPSPNALRFIFPNAPFREITINNGMLMRGWYDIYQLNLLTPEDKKGIIKSSQLIQGLIAKEIELGIKSNHIILGGFSQGGAIALYSGLRSSWQLGGIIGLSTYQPLAKELDNEYEKNTINHTTPIFMAHGLFDPIVPINLGQQALQQLQRLNYQVTWKTYPMQHTVINNEINDINIFIQNCLKI